MRSRPAILRRLIAFRKSPDLGSAFAVAVILSAAPFAVACYGYGSYLRYSWPFAWIPAVIAGSLLHSGWRLIRLLWKLAHNEPPQGKEARECVRIRLPAVMLFCVFFFVGWGVGNLCRGIHCRGVGARCEPVLEALEEYRSEHGAYPGDLAALPNIESLKADAGITIRQGRFLEDGILLDIMDEADAVIYLEPEGYACYVPIEHRFIMSFTRFYVYVRSSRDADWKRDYIGWCFTAM